MPHCQVGRAGRDGEPASCHLFLDDADFLRLRSLAHSDGVDAPVIASFLRAAFGDETPEVQLFCERLRTLRRHLHPRITQPFRALDASHGLSASSALERDAVDAMREVHHRWGHLQHGCEVVRGLTI